MPRTVQINMVVLDYDIIGPIAKGDVVPEGSISPSTARRPLQRSAAATRFRPVRCR